MGVSEFTYPDIFLLEGASKHCSMSVNRQNKWVLRSLITAADALWMANHFKASVRKLELDSQAFVFTTNSNPVLLCDDIPSSLFLQLLFLVLS